jgi:hypothetical protein
MEATHCYGGSGCSQQGLTLPVLEYAHADGCSITGGYVYRGLAIPELAGTYLYADYCSGRFGSLKIEGGELAGAAEVTGELNPDGIEDITSFGTDNAGELYVLARPGTLLRLEAE